MPIPTDIPLTSDQVLFILQLLIFLLLVIVLYQLMFAAFNLRRILKRVNKVTEGVEEVVMKPITMADAIVEWVAKAVEDFQRKQVKKSGKSKKAKKSKK